MNHFTTHKSYILVPLQVYDEEFKKINFFLQILDKSGIDEIIYTSYSKNKKRGRSSYNPYHMFSTIAYCFAIRMGTLRQIEEMCNYDLRTMYLMDNERPSYKTFFEFINEVILPNQYVIFTKICNTIIETFQLNITNQYLDGTKIEANANKYNFVWKPIKFHKNLDDKIKEQLKLMNIDFNPNELIKSNQLFEAINLYAKDSGFNPKLIPSGKGKRISKEQRYYKQCYKYLIKLIEYEEKETICGHNRNSYYKTDHDATGMALKTDYYSGHGSNLHAAYNLQILVSSGVILFYGIFQDRTDYYTLKPLLDNYYKYYQSFPTNLCADSGYGIYENYKYLQENNIGNYVKFLSWNGESSAKNPQLFYYSDDGNFTCLGGNIATAIKYDTKHHQRKKGATLYKFSGCNICDYSKKCKEKLKDKTSNFRLVELIPEYEAMKQNARDNLLSRKGIEIRVNRSIQVEGTFGQIKQNMGYVRIRRRGIEKVGCEIMLVCLGRNIRKIFSMRNQDCVSDTYWKAPLNMPEETFIKPKKN